MSLRDDALDILDREMTRLNGKPELGLEDTKILCSLVDAYIRLCSAPPKPPNRGKFARTLTFKKTKNASLVEQLKKDAIKL